MDSDRKPRSILLLAGLFLVYGFSAYFGLKFSAINKFSALVWLPSGIAFAAMVISGRWVWPAVFFSAFAVNYYTGAPFAAAIGIAAGNTLEGVAAASLCSTSRGFRVSLDRLSDVIKLISASVVCTLISASIGVTSLWLNGTLSGPQVLDSWTQWWAGDALGAMSITPLLLTLSRRDSFQRLSWSNAGIFEKIAFAVILFGLSFAVLSGSPFLVTLIGLRAVYILVPMLLWGAMRFGQRGAAVVTFTICLFAAWNTAHGIGPFIDQSFVANLLNLFVFVVTIAITGMFVGSVVSERESERQVAEFANSAKSEFLANMSHEIRTPLGAVIGFSELVADPEISDEKRGDYLAAIHRNGEALTNLINDILDLSRIEAGKVTVHVTEAAVAEVVKDVQVVLAKKAEEKKIDIKVVIDGSVPEIISTDAMRLRQILINLLGNAIKFTQHGSVSLTVQRDRQTLLFTVQDTGVGIRQEDIEKLFKSFSQADTSFKRRHGGTGLGLVLARRLAQLLGGDVVLKETALGVGSTFILTIDIGAESLESLERTSKTSGDEQSLRGLSILLAEDLLDNQVMISQILQLVGAKVDMAQNGKEAVEKALKGRYDVILMDLQMPVMDGYEATASLRQSGYHGKIIAVTAYALENEKQRCLESGFDGHIAKPVRRAELVGNLQQFLLKC
jgi:signal transduction histidine kinase